MQSRFDDAEHRLQQHVTSAITKEVEKLHQDPETNQRLAVVENQIQSLVENQTKLEHWVADGSSKAHGLQQDRSQLREVVQPQGHTLQNVVAEVGTCNTSLATHGTGSKWIEGRHQCQS